MSLASCSGFDINKIIINQFSHPLFKSILTYKSTKKTTLKKGRQVRMHFVNEGLVISNIISMNSQLLSRLGQIKQYISTLNDSLSLNDHVNASTVVSRFKKSMIKSDEQVHASQFVLDCLKTKNQKLKQQLYELEQQKKQMQAKLFTNKAHKAEIKQCKVEIFITRLTVTLNQSRKVDYDQATIASDYKNIIVNSSVGKKYIDHLISIQEIQQLEHKGNMLYLCIISVKVYHILIKFKQEKQAMKWALCLKYGQMIIKNTKKKQKLFEEEKEVVKAPTLNPNPTSPISLTVTPPAANSNTSPSAPFRNSMAKSLLNISQVPFLNLTNQNKAYSPSQSLIQQKKYNQKSFDKQVGDRSGQKNTERSLVNAMNYEGNRSSGTFNIKDTINSKYDRRLDLNRPPNLSKVRNSSSNDYSGGFEGLKAYRTSSNFRKQSEDFIKPHINQVYHQMMENYRPKEEKQDQLKSQSNFKMSLPQIQKLNSNLASPQKSSKIKMLQEKKKELLKSNVLTIQKPSFVFDNKVSWMGIQEMDDQNKSKSSNHISNKSRRGSEFSESAIAHSSEHAKKQPAQQDHSEHITQKSQEQSPRLPKNSTPYDVPHKVSYNNGIVFQLHQVEKGVSTPIIPSKAQHQIQHSYKQPSSSSSQSEDEDHSDPSSHQNHTESEDNNARAQELKKGITVVKCSENGFWTHQKILFLSDNENDLLSRDIKDKKIKKIKLSNIKEVEYKKFDKGIIKHISKIEEDKCFVIRALDDDNKIKNFEFVSNLAEPLQRFATNLKLYVEYFRQQ